MIEYRGRKFYGRAEVAKILAVQGRTVHGWILAKKLAARKIGGRWYVSEEELEDFMKIEKIEQKPEGQT